MLQFNQKKKLCKRLSYRQVGTGVSIYPKTEQWFRDEVIGLDDRYLKMAEDLLYGEMAVALGIEKKDVQAYITEEIQKASIK